MIIYKDVCTNDELFSDAYSMSFKGEDKFIVVVQAKMVTKKADSVSADLIGGNPSQEEQEECTDDPSSVSGLDLCMAQGLCDQSDYFCSKKVFQSYMKKFVKNVAQKFIADGETERNEKFMKECKEKFKYFLDLYDPDEDTIYTGGQFDPEDAMSCPMIGKWSEDGMSVNFLLLNIALNEEKQ
jgi:hypothetical protein